MAKSQRTIDRELKRLRSFIDQYNDDPSKLVEIRVAYEVEIAIRWATDKTVGWPNPLHSALTTAALIRKGI